MDIRLIKKLCLPAAIVSLLLTSCLPDNDSELQEEHDRDLQSLLTKYGMTDSDEIEEGIWMKLDNSDVTYPDQVPGENDWIIVDVLGTTGGGEVIDVSDSAKAKELDVYRNDLVYGPIRLELKSTFYAFYKVLQQTPLNAEVTMVCNHENALNDFRPLAYKAKLHRIIKDFEEYKSESDFTYFSKMDIAVDSFSTNQIYFDTVQPPTDTTQLDMEVGDSVVVRLYSYYVEWDSVYQTSYPGRQYFPINNSEDIVSVVLGEQIFPYFGRLNDEVRTMRIGEKRRYYFPSDAVFNGNGFRHPWVGKYIIPPTMSVHVEIELVHWKPYN